MGLGHQTYSLEGSGFLGLCLFKQWSFHPGWLGYIGDEKKLASYMDVSENSRTPKSSILIGFSIINHPFWGTPIFGNTHMVIKNKPISGFPLNSKLPGWS